MITLEKAIVCDLCGKKEVFEDHEMSLEAIRQFDVGWRENPWRFSKWIHLTSMPETYILEKHYSDFCSVDCLKVFINKYELACRKELIERELISREENKKNIENSNKTPHKECSCKKAKQVVEDFVKNLDQLYHPPQDELKNTK